jgi:osmotically-inducible protein OsmY
VARVRADLGHWTDRAGAIEVAADRGTVTLRGEVSREAVGDMLSAVRRVPGVERVVNHLTVRETSAGSFAGPRPD